MGRINFTLRQKKMIAVGGVLVMLAAAYRMAPLLGDILLIQDDGVTEQRIFSLRKKVARKKDLTRQQSMLEKELSRLETGLLKGTTLSLAAVSMQNLLYELASQNDVKVQSVRVLKPEKSEDEALAMYSIITIQARMELSISELQEMLYGFAKSPYFIAVDSLDAQSVKKGATGRVTSTITLKGLKLD